MAQVAVLKEVPRNRPKARRDGRPYAPSHDRPNRVQTCDRGVSRETDPVSLQFGSCRTRISANACAFKTGPQNVHVRVSDTGLCRLYLSGTIRSPFHGWQCIEDWGAVGRQGLLSEVPTASWRRPKEDRLRHQPDREERIQPSGIQI
jgi:hypothetical protein